MKIEGAASPRFWRWLWVAAFADRALVGLLRPVPAEDGANYLWMAERFAEGRADLALSEVFPPLWPLGIAPFIWLGVDPFFAGRLVAALVGASAVVAIGRLTERLVPSGGIVAGCLMAFAPLPVRYGAMCYSEPLFLWLAAIAVDQGLRGGHARCGLLSGLAFWTRPEGALVACAVALARPARALRTLIPLAVLVAALGAWRAAVGHGFDPVAKLDFNLTREHHEGFGIDGVGRLVANVARTAWLWFEAFGPLGVLGVLAIAGGFAVARPATREAVVRPELASPGRAFAALGVVIVLGLLIVCAFLPRRRFLVNWTFAVVPFAAAGFRLIPAPGRWPTLFVIVVVSLITSLQLAPRDRYAERRVGEALRTRLAAGERVEGDMTRVIYFSGSRPLPPRKFDADQLISRAADPAVRFVVLGARRPTAAPVAAALTGSAGGRAGPFEAVLDLPAEVARAARERGITVLRRAQPR